MSMCISRVALSLLSTMKLSYQRIHVANRRRSGGPGGDLRWRSSLRLTPAPPIYEVMGDHGSPPGPPIASQYPRGARDQVLCADNK